MQICLISVGRHMPAWAEEGFREYTKRFPPECALRLVEIALGLRRKGGDSLPAVRAEGARMLKALPKNSQVVATDVRGAAWSTEQLARKLAAWMADGRNVALLVGGPEGLAPACLDRADQRWSLSRLTFPHPLVRVILAEQLYRAWSILRNHPYHRA